MLSSPQFSLKYLDKVVIILKKRTVAIGYLLETETDKLLDSSNQDAFDAVYDSFYTNFYRLRFTVFCYAGFKTDDEKVTDKVERIFDINHRYLNTTFNEFFFYDFEDDDAFSDAMSHGYFFEKISNYFEFLLCQLLKLNPNICDCFNCDRLFIAKTNHTTNYCDRIITDDGKTCRQVGPANRERILKRNLPIFKDYKLATDKNYRRVIRAEKSTSFIENPKALDYETYEEWQKRAKKAYDDFQDELITEDEFYAVLNELE